MDEACLLLAEYNGRLAAELEDRRQLARMLTEYINSQKEALNEREKKLEVQHPGILQFISQTYIKSLNKVLNSSPDIVQYGKYKDHAHTRQVFN